MDHTAPALQTYNGGIIFVSYLIAVVGSMTTLELLQRRTHISGNYNWFLLFLAAASMGGVGIWCMHFIGNNSLTITLDNNHHYQLNYTAGFTFASLVVAIITMFLAFIFVGITEEAKIKRIIFSGFVAGLGIVSMHYLGQVAIDFFTTQNKLPYVLGAAVIAICATTTVLFIFFKLREQWENQWYNRLGCAMLMGAAVCGMHYTALLGTVYYPGNSETGPPKPVLRTPALIGTIAAIVVVACLILCFFVAKTGIENTHLSFRKKSYAKRLILDCVLFDTNGRILVKVDGSVPMKEVLQKLPEEDQYGAFSVNHPLFIRLFETSLQWSNIEEKQNDVFSESSNVQLHNTMYDFENDAFVNAATALMEDLRFGNLSDLGHLHDSVLYTDTITKRSVFSRDTKRKFDIQKSNHTNSLLLSSKNPVDSKEYTEELGTTSKNMKKEISENDSLVSLPENITIINVFEESSDTTQKPSKKILSTIDSRHEDKHIFLIRRIENNRQLQDLLSVGFRFAEPVFIAKTMGQKLKVPSELMLNCFRDMLSMVETVNKIYTPSGRPPYSTLTKSIAERNCINLQGGIFVGLFALMEEEGSLLGTPSIVIDKSRRNIFPLVRLTLGDGTGPDGNITELTRDQRSVLINLSGRSLASISSVCSSNNLRRDPSSNSIYNNTTSNIGETANVIQEMTSSSDNLGIISGNKDTDINQPKDKEASQSFLEALEAAAKALISISRYGKHLALSASLHGDIFDIPAFSLRSGPGQLILFRGNIVDSGIQSAINQTVTETIKCVPFPLFKTFAHHVTSIAIEKYKMDQFKNNASSSYLTQKRLYQSMATSSNASYMENEVYELEDTNSQTLIKYKPTNSNEQVDEHTKDFSSLPPPPRAKRNKMVIKSAISALNAGIEKGFLPDIIKSTKSITLGPSNASHIGDQSATLNILPLKNRFWWLDSVYEETYNSI